MDKLTAKQEAFAQSIADGNDQATAYRAAYDAGSMKDETVYSNASRLMNNSKVIARVKQLKAETADKQLWTREMSVKGLMSAYKLAQQHGQATGMTGAVKELNIMHGFNEPTKLTVDMKFKPITDEDWL
jgi:phage terminase small subunit